MYELAKKVIFKFDPEDMHNLVIKALKTQRFLKVIDYKKTYKNLENELFGMKFSNPVGLAAGFDKNAEVVSPLANLGFGFIEVGAITPKAQPGNPRPRIERLVDELSIRNAMGFNNDGVEIAKANLMRENFSKLPPIFINIGKNKITPNEEAINDYEILVRELKPYADAFVINISSPNTPNLRDLQNAEFIENIFKRLNEINSVPKFIKFAPDMDFGLATELALTALENNATGVILSNTTQDYSLSKKSDLTKVGGLSGKVLANKSLDMLKAIAPSIHKKGVIISSGGIFDGNDAYERIKWGANLVQVYTAMIFNGPRVARNINDELTKLLKNDGLSSINQAIGVEL
ncbi:quinone-dependent dihydroorotate dehydrogenase [Campylobacter sp. Cr9]|uniref:quinone-dependent dihydroorotate dehydrogenase n=1 Tax=Campylobacter sp. Cr9 TaxID=2735728 RepID=UPI003015130D|nr:quinone-dependent dihydroorotate dehydrogenase [Campylobacter sp. Cr9]